MRNVVLLGIVLLFTPFVWAQTSDTLTPKLVPVDVLLAKVRPDSSAFEADSLRVDTVYIDNCMNVIKASVDFASAFGMLGLTYERVISYMGSAQLRVEYLGVYNPLSSVPFIDDAYKNTSSISGIGLCPEARYYGSEKYAPKGLFVGLYLPMRFAQAKVPQYLARDGALYKVKETSQRYTLFGLGVSGGYQLVYKKNITVELVSGLSIGRGYFSDPYFDTSNLVVSEDFNSKINLKDGNIGQAFYPRFEFTVGYTFGK